MGGQRETWKTHLGMLFAMIGTEVGLGNVWRFPYLCGKYGGGSFLVPYMVLLLGVAMFGMMAEWVIGRHTRREPMGAFQKIRFPFGRDIGAWGVIGPFFLYSYYIVVTAWVLFFIVASVAGLYFGEETMAYFVGFLGTPWVFVAHAAAVAFTSLVLSFGVQKGIERACKFMIPTLFVLLIIVAVRSLTLPGAAAGVEFYMRPRWEGIANPEAWLAALGQVFFTLSLGMGAMIIYGSYMKKSWGIPLNAMACSLGNASASILAGFAIFPAAFALGFGAEVKTEAVGLTFIVLPKVFATMPAGQLFGGLFFLLLAFGALSSAISIQEPSIAWMKDELRWPRRKSALLTGVILWVMGLPFVLNGFIRRGAGGVPAGLGDKLALLDKMDKLINNLGLPLFALLAILAVGWVMKKKGFEELNRNARFRIGRWVKPWMRYVVPAIFLFIFVVNLLNVLFPSLQKEVLGEAKLPDFVPIGLTPATVITIVVVCGVVWGGAIGGFLTVVGIERRKERGAAAQGGGTD